MAKKSASKKGATRKTASQKSVNRKAASGKSASRKTASQKSANRKAASGKSASRKTAEKSEARKTAARKTAAKRSASPKTKSWKDKMQIEREGHEAVHATKKGMMYISSPAEIDGIIKKIPRGRLITTKKIADRLTKQNGADFTCPLTTGIFVSLAANVAEEEFAQGRKRITPYWRVIKPDGSLYPKYLGSILPQRKRLEEEGFAIEPGKGKKPPRIRDFEKFCQSD